MIQIASEAQQLNLTAYRTPGSVFSRVRAEQSRRRTRLIRGMMAGSGVVIAAQGLRSLGWRERCLVLAGSAIALWAVTGQPEGADVRAWLTVRRRRLPWSHHDRVAEESAESFPASDAPSWTPTMGTQPGGD
jgi:hypothetical protein